MLIERNQVRSGASLGDLLLRAIRRYPGRIAVIDDHESLTYRDFEGRMAGYLELFHKAEVKRGSGLAQLSLNCVDAAAVVAAAWIYGLRYTPLHPRGTETDHAFILQDAEIDVLVVDCDGFPCASETLGAHLTGRRTVIHHIKRGSAPPPAECPRRAQSTEDDIAAILYTGGTTGRPKGVVHRHDSLIANALIELAELDWPAELRFLAVTPISHATLGFILPVFVRGGTFILKPHFNPSDFVATVRALRATATFLVPTMLNVLLDSTEAQGADTSTLQMLIYGASPISPPRLRQAIARFGDIFVQVYGQTEAPNVIAILRNSDHGGSEQRLSSCGVPTSGLDVRLLNDAGAEVGVGEVGEICVRGPLIMDGYWKRPEETADTLANGWLHTGDLARADHEGYLTIVDRKKDLIISGGFNIIPREIEDVLHTHPAVSQACVIGVPDPKWGEAVKAIVVKRKGHPASPEELIRHVRESKGGMYAPRTIDFVDAIPVTAVGKPDKKALRAPYWTGRERNVI